jgi:dihydrofolate reductase
MMVIKMKIVCVFAVTPATTKNTFAFGAAGDLVSTCKEDLQHFRNITSSYPLIMGRLTYESIGSKDLPNRPSIVITSDKTVAPLTAPSLEHAVSIAKDMLSTQVCIVGGAALIQHAMQTLADEAEITVYNTTVPSERVDVFIDNDALLYSERWETRDVKVIPVAKCSVLGAEQWLKLHFIKWVRRSEGLLDEVVECE